MSVFTIALTVAEAEQTIRRAVAVAGFEVFKLEVDDTSILLSMDLVPGDKESRKANYVPCGDGRLVSAVNDIRIWVDRVARGVSNVVA